MSTTTTPNMNLIIPGVGTEAGPDYATDINNSLSIIDSHTHTSGSGVPITPDAININALLPMNNFGLTDAAYVNLFPQASAPTNISLYAVLNDLYFVDGVGNHIRITQSGSVSGASGTITGLPSGTASASFAAGTFVFQASTNTSAVIDGGSFILRNNTASSKGLTLSPPNAMGADYGLVLPSLPAQTNVMILDASGNMGSITYAQTAVNMGSTGANSLNSQRTMAVSNPALLNGMAQGAPINTSTTSADPVLASTVELTTSGRPVMVIFAPNTDAGPGNIGAGTSLGQVIMQNRQTGIVFYNGYLGFGVGLQGTIVGISAQAAGVYDFDIFIQTTGGGSVDVTNMVQTAVEL